jgi:DNA-binding transcriptional ArsR family regulator
MNKSKECCPAATHLAPVQSEEEANGTLARFAKALGHPTRVAIMRLLIQRQSCICGEIVDELPIAQSTVSRHLAHLKDAGLIRGEIDGPRVCYCIEPQALALFKTLCADL